jgi:hypothetical protein
MLKFMSAVPCSKMCSLLENMQVYRYFYVFLGDRNSRWSRLNNGLPQGSDCIDADIVQSVLRQNNSSAKITLR